MLLTSEQSVAIFPFPLLIQIICFSSLHFLISAARSYQLYRFLFCYFLLFILGIICSHFSFFKVQTQVINLGPFLLEACRCKPPNTALVTSHTFLCCRIFLITQFKIFSSISCDFCFDPMIIEKNIIYFPNSVGVVWLSYFY